MWMRWIHNKTVNICGKYSFSRTSIWVFLKLVRRRTQHFSKIHQEKCPSLPNLLRKHWFLSSVWYFCVVTHTESQTCLLVKHARSKDRHLFSQATGSQDSGKQNRCERHTMISPYRCTNFFSGPGYNWQMINKCLEVFLVGADLSLLYCFIRDWFYAKRLSLSVKKEAVNMDSTEAQVVSFSWGLTKVTS